jgi:hypothetical protein
LVNEKSIEAFAYSIVMLIVLFILAAALVPTGQTAGDSLCNSGVPLGSLFSRTGVVWIIVMAGIVISVLRYVFTQKK